MKNIAIEWSDFNNPCYDPYERYGGCPPTLLDVLTDERIILEERVWAFCNCKKVPDKEKRVFAIKVVRETPLWGGGTVIDLITDQRSLDALIVVEKFVNGEATDRELAAARAAIRRAAKHAARDAVNASVLVSVIDAVRGSTWDAAKCAALASTWDATRDAAMGVSLAVAGDVSLAAALAAAFEAQLKIAIAMINHE